MRAKGDRQPPQDVRLPRWPHKRVVGLVLSAVVLAGGGGLIAGHYLRGPDTATLANSLRNIIVTAHVETRGITVDPFQANLDASTTQVVLASLPPDTIIPVITATPAVVGHVVSSGQTLIAINDRPVIALSLTVPMYRDLHLDDTGPDVQSLNQTLSDVGLLRGTITAAYSDKTRLGVKALYERAQFAAAGTPTGTVLPMREILSLESTSLAVAKQAALHSVATVGEPILTLQSQVNKLNVRVDTLTKGLLEVAGTAKVSAQTSAEQRTATIDSLSGFRGVDAPISTDNENATSTGALAAGTPSSGGVSSFPGFDVALTIDFGSAGNPWVAGTTLIVQFNVVSAPKTAVPLSGIRERGGKTFVWLERDGKFAEVPITVVDQKDGWALLGDEQTISAGDEIRIRP